jgi:hypothetical protein
MGSGVVRGPPEAGYVPKRGLPAPPLQLIVPLAAVLRIARASGAVASGYGGLCRAVTV